MDSQTLILIGLALVFGLYMAWSIGANDVANAMGTSVGSGALTLKRAVILAAIMEFGGAFLVGPHVSETVRKGIIDTHVFIDDPLALVLGMLAALLAAAVWLQVASYFGWPVSTTHSIVGAIVGFGIAYSGMAVIQWGQVGTIVASWVVSPVLSGLIAFVAMRFILTGIFYKPDPVAAAKKATPYIVFTVMVTMILVLTFKGLKPFWKYPFWQEQFGVTFKSHLDAIPLAVGLMTAALAGTAGALISRRLVARIGDGDTIASQQLRDIYVTRTLSKALMHLRRVRNTSSGSTRTAAIDVLGKTEQIYDSVQSQSGADQGRSPYRSVERIFVYLQVISAGFVAFAHGANDVANAIGPVSVVVETARTMQVPQKSFIPVWMLALGGIGIVIGLATWGWRVIQTVGKRITELTPSRGFCAEFAAAGTILVASVYALPISTTHTLVGAVLGVGLARGIGALNLRTVRDIVISWMITIPAGAGLSILFYYTLAGLFG